MLKRNIKQESDIRESDAVAKPEPECEKSRPLQPPTSTDNDCRGHSIQQPDRKSDVFQE